MSMFKPVEREQAIRRGLEFIYRLACDPAHFAEYGSDLLNCFFFISTTSADTTLRRAARRMGRERARQWRLDYPRLPKTADADMILDFLHGSYAAHRLGLPDRVLKEEIQRTAQSFSARDFLLFDPCAEPPPTDVPEQCDCGEWNKRGTKTCRTCKRRLTMMSRYAVWYDALIRTYSAERYGIKLGARYAHVLKWLPSMRPYRAREADANPDFYDTVYAITHIIYTLNDYSVYNLSPRWLPEEFRFLKTNLAEAMVMEDAEMVGELLDTLRAFGLQDSHPLIRTGINYLLVQQNEDGSWGEMETDDIYQRYHPTWTALDGLREYRWRGERLSFPKLQPLLKTSARS